MLLNNCSSEFKKIIDRHKQDLKQKREMTRRLNINIILEERNKELINQEDEEDLINEEIIKDFKASQHGGASPKDLVNRQKLETLNKQHKSSKRFKKNILLNFIDGQPVEDSHEKFINDNKRRSARKSNNKASVQSKPLILPKLRKEGRNSPMKAGVAKESSLLPYLNTTASQESSRVPCQKIEIKKWIGEIERLETQSHEQRQKSERDFEWYKKWSVNLESKYRRVLQKDFFIYK